MNTSNRGGFQPTPTSFDQICSLIKGLGVVIMVVIMVVTVLSVITRHYGLTLEGFVGFAMSAGVPLVVAYFAFSRPRKTFIWTLILSAPMGLLEWNSGGIDALPMVIGSIFLSAAYIATVHYGGKYLVGLYRANKHKNMGL